MEPSWSTRFLLSFFPFNNANTIAYWKVFSRLTGGSFWPLPKSPSLLHICANVIINLKIVLLINYKGPICGRHLGYMDDTNLNDRDSCPHEALTQDFLWYLEDSMYVCAWEREKRLDCTCRCLVRSVHWFEYLDAAIFFCQFSPFNVCTYTVDTWTTWGLGAPNPCTVENLHVIFDSYKT